MKPKTVLRFLLTMAAAAVVLTGCDDIGEEKGLEPVPSAGNAELSSLSINDTNVPLPAVIPEEVWNSKRTLGGYTGEITFPANADLAAITIQTVAGENAVIEYAVGVSTARPAENSFKAITGPVTLSPGYLYIKVTEDGTINYYRFSIGLEGPEVPEVQKVTVTFDTTGGTPQNIGQVIVTKGDSLGGGFPADPEKAGYRFGGWFSGAVQYDKDTAINSDVTLTAKWTEVITVSFDTNGGTPQNIGQVIVTKGASLGGDFPAAPQKDGYDFAGWFNGDAQYNRDTPVNSDITLTARWTAWPTVTEFNLDKSAVTLTMFSSEQLTWKPADINAKQIAWSSSAPAIASVDEYGKIKALNFSGNGTAVFNTTPATGTAVITGTVNGISRSITVTTTMTAQVSINTLPPMKDQFKDYFLMGNIGTATDTRNLRHYNILTPENTMKPSYFTSARNATTGVITYTWTQPDNYVNQGLDNGYLVHGHTLLWHSQNANWMWDQIASKTGTIVSGMTKEKALEIMKQYITDVASRYKGKLHSWDVLNEAFPDNAANNADWKNAIRRNASGEGQDANPWYIAIGSDFVYEGFLAARLADPVAILYYNDYNTDNTNRARLIRDMVKEVNEKYLASGDKPAGEDPARLLIEGIGMQEHHNTGVTAAQIRATINTFRPLGVKLSVSELDVLGQTYNQYSSSSGTATGGTVTNDGLMTQARLYNEFMKVYLDNADIIERVTLWGVADNNSWRARGLPLLFNTSNNAKPSYYRMIEALEQKKLE